MDKIVFFDIDQTIFDTEHYYRTNFLEFKPQLDATDVIESIKKIAFVGIFSEGEIDLQIEKLRKTGLLKFFNTENIFISEKKTDLLEGIIGKHKNKKIFIVDDRLFFLHFAKKIDSRIVSVWLARGYWKDKQDPIPGFEPDYVVSNLFDIVPIVS